MTGVEFKAKFNTEYDEAYSGYWDDAKLNRLVESAVVDVIETKIEEFQSSGKITDDLLPLLAEITLNATNNLIAVSAITNYKRLSNVKVLFAGRTTTRTAKELKRNQQIGEYGRGSVLYPKYEFVSNNLRILPLSATATSATIQYIRTAIPIIVTGITAIPYNDKTIETILARTMAIASAANRELDMYNLQEIERRTDK